MKIIEFELSEIGLHKHIKATLGSPLVGLLGPNACGKSTILGFLGFLFTGITAGEPPEPQETFVRFWGREGAAANGWGRAKFIQHGKVGEIFRQVGKTPKRWLKWGDETFKTAKDIERVLTEILGSNRKAMTQAIFIPQGELDKLFFGGEAEREEMFVKLLQLGYMEKTEKLISDKVNFVSAGVQDLTLLVDEIGTQRNAVEVALADLERELNSTRDWSQDLHQLQEYRSLVQQADGEFASCEQHQRQLVTNENNLKDVLSKSDVRVGGSPLASSLEARGQIDLRRAKHREVSTQMQEIKGAQQLLIDWQTLQGRIAEVTNSYTGFSEEYSSYENAAARPRLQDKIKAITDWESAEAEAKKTLAAAQAASAEVANFGATPSVSADALANAEKIVDDAVALSSAASLKVTTWSAVVGTTVHVCPVCEQAFDTSTISPDKLNEAKQALAITEGTSQAAIQALRALQTQQRNYEKRRAELFGAWNAAVAKAKASENNAPRPEGNKAELEAQDAEIVAAQARMSALEGPIAGYKAELERLRIAAAEVPQADLAVAALKFKPAVLGALETQLNEIDQQIKDLEELVAVCRPAEDAVVSTRELIASSRTKHQHLLAQAQVSQGKFSQTLAAFLESPEVPEGMSVWDAVEQQLQGRVSTRLQLAGRVRQAREQADGIRKKQEDLNTKIEGGAARKALKKELLDLRGVFTRSGLPMRFVRYKFEQLAELTRQSLVELEANFSVQVDPAHSVSFTFTRMDEGEPYTMPQNKLSGGQKVRLSTAFLLAVQKLLVPEVAFLVLDEPSLHLDLEGKDNLKEMLISMGARLGNSESQIWICDHAPELEPAFGNIIRIKP